MRKMPCLFVRAFANGGSTITEEWDPKATWVRDVEGIATRKWDGTACLVRDGVLFKRYDAKRGKAPPDGWEACGEPDPVTGHHPGWLRVDSSKPEDKWHACITHIGDGAGSVRVGLADGTYELCGPAIGSNHEGLIHHMLIPHGRWVMEVPDRSFEGLREYLRTLPMEGIVFRHPDGRMAKIRRHDFGFEWPIKTGASCQ
jgi:hypothetical protein